jgi:hypothetical protein
MWVVEWKSGEIFNKNRMNLYLKLTVTKETIKTDPAGLLSKVGLTKK